MPLPSKVKIVEVGPRDGLQNEKQVVATATKIELIERLADAGLRVIEATSFVSPKWVPQMGDNTAVMQGIRKAPCCGLPGFDAQFAGLRCGAAGGGDRGRHLRRGFGEFLEEEHQLLDCREPEALRAHRLGGLGAGDQGARLRVVRRRLPLRGRHRPAAGGGRGADAVRHGLLRGVARRHHRRRHAGQHLPA